MKCLEKSAALRTGGSNEHRIVLQSELSSQKRQSEWQLYVSSIIAGQTWKNAVYFWGLGKSTMSVQLVYDNSAEHHDLDIIFRPLWP